MSLTWTEIPFITFDTETTGFRSSDRLVEFAAVKRLPGGERTHLHSLINPGFPIPQDSSNVHGIYDSHVSSAPTWEEFEPEMLNFMSSDAPWVAHNAPFDVRMLTYCSPNMPVSPFVFCSMSYAKKRHPILKHRRRGHKVEDLAEFFGVPFDASQAHSALYDAEALCTIVIKMLDGIPVRHVIDGFEW